MYSTVSWDILDQHIISTCFQSLTHPYIHLLHDKAFPKLSLHPFFYQSIHPFIHLPDRPSHFSSLHFSPHLFVLVSVTPFQSLWLAAGRLGHVVHWLGRSGNTLCLSSHTIYYLDWETPRTQELVLTWTLTHTQSHTEEYKQHSVWELQRGLFTRVTQMFLLAPQQVVVGRLRGPFWGLGGRRGPNRAPEPGWELPLWDTKHCLCWERPWGWEHRPELDTEQRF